MSHAFPPLRLPLLVAAAAMLADASAFSGPQITGVRRSATAAAHRSTSSHRSTCHVATRQNKKHSHSRPLLMLQAKQSGEEEAEEVQMHQYAMNLEGHFKHGAGFVPHAFKVEGDFIAGCEEDKEK